MILSHSRFNNAILDGTKDTTVRMSFKDLNPIINEVALNAKLRELERLQRDSGDVAPLTSDAIVATRELILNLSIVPINNGGIQIEMHGFAGDVEVEIGPDGRVTPDD